MEGLVYVFFVTGWKGGVMVGSTPRVSVVLEAWTRVEVDPLILMYNLSPQLFFECSVSMFSKSLMRAIVSLELLHLQIKTEAMLQACNSQRSIID